MIRFLWLFFVYAFLGWCTEVAFVAWSSGGFVNRGFLNGPICPVYGFGALLVLACLEPLRGDLPLLFLGSFVLTTLLEGMTGFLLEKLFHQRWWDYSDKPLNLAGYVCLPFSLAWAAACVVVVRGIHPAVTWALDRLPPIPAAAGAAVMTLAAAFDLAATLRTVARMNRSLGRIDALVGQIRALSDGFGEGLAARVLYAAARGADLEEVLAAWAQEHGAALEARLGGLSERGNALLAEGRTRAAQLQEHYASLREQLETLGHGPRRLLLAFPGLRSLDHHQALEQLRHWLEERRNAR